MEDLRKLVSEYGKIGSNLNQIARYFNTGGDWSLAIENEIHQYISDLFQLRKKVLRMASLCTADNLPLYNVQVPSPIRQHRHLDSNVLEESL